MAKTSVKDLSKYLASLRHIKIAGTPEVIAVSNACDRKHCLMVKGVEDTLVALTGVPAKNLNIRATDAGMTFDYDGYRYFIGFKQADHNRLHKFDAAFNRAKAKGCTTAEALDYARATVKPFNTTGLFNNEPRRKVGVKKWTKADKVRVAKIRQAKIDAGEEVVRKPRARQLSI